MEYEKINNYLNHQSGVKHDIHLSCKIKNPQPDSGANFSSTSSLDQKVVGFEFQWLMSEATPKGKKYQWRLNNYSTALNSRYMDKRVSVKKRDLMSYPFTMSHMMESLVNT